MKVLVIEKFNRRGEPQLPGSVIDIPADGLIKLTGYVQPLNDGRELPHYCSAGDCWCSSRLPAHLNPTACHHCGGET